MASAAGLALRAAQPHTELTTTSVGARSPASTASTADAVRSSSKPRRGSSSRIGRTISGSYIGTFRLRISILALFLEKRADCRAEIGCTATDGVDIGAQPEAVVETESVQLVELLLGERQRRGAGVHQAAVLPA